MKILIGVCGIGMGHCVRQFEICNELVKRGHQVRILTFGEGVSYFKKLNANVYPVFVPYITYQYDKLNILDVLRRNASTILPGILCNFRVIKKLKADNFIPDLCISDYEPITAQIAYLLKRPLVTIDQQSKFIYMDENSIDGFSCTEEKKRLKLFFPKVDRKYILSFYRLGHTVLPQNVELLYPVLRKEVRDAPASEKKKKIVVYFSKYIDIPIQQSMNEIINVFHSYPQYDFLLFSNELYESGQTSSSNVTILPNSTKEFATELSTSVAAISTAGHTMISECIFFNTPIFVIPLPTFDQHYCAKFISQNMIGYSAKTITTENLSYFLDNLDIFSANINLCQDLIPPSDSLQYLLDRLEEYSV